MNETGSFAGAYGVMNTLRALEHLARGPHSAPELAQALQIDVRSTRRMPRRFAAEGYAVQDPGHRRRYRTTLRLVALGCRGLAHALLPRAAARLIAALAQMTSRPAHLWISVGDDVYCVIHADPAVVADTPRIGILDPSSDIAPAAVLDPARRWQRSYAYAREDATATTAAAVIDRGLVVAAVGVTGNVEPELLAPVVDTARDLTRALADAACGRC